MGAKMGPSYPNLFVGYIEHQFFNQYNGPKPGGRFLKAPESFRARKAIFRSSVSKNGEVYTPETSCMKGTSLHL